MSTFKMNKSILAVATAAILASGCSLAPDYERPAAPVAPEWNGSADVAAPAPWKDQFTDPELQKLIELSLANNRDLKLAILAVKKFEVMYNIERLELVPSGVLNASKSRSENTLNNGILSQTYTVGMNFSWEIDFWGKVRNEGNVALENYFAAKENRKSAQMTLIASVATAYYSYVADKEMLALYKETLKTEQESYNLTKQQYEIGAASELVMSQARTAVAQAEVNVASYERVLELDRNSLLVLVGTNLPEIDSLKRITNIEVSAIPVGTMSTVLEQRPDIMAAEHALKAANFNIGVARAMMLPSFSLAGSLGTISTNSDGLFKSGSKYWSFVPSVALPVIDQLSLYDNVKLAELEKEAAIVSYEKVIQNAFLEVSDAIKSFDSLNKQYESQKELHAATKKYFELADLRYHEGIDSYLTRLDAQRLYVSACQGLIQTKLQQLKTQINLYKAIGGGWNYADDESEEL